MKKATLVVLDEVNCKFVGLDADVRRELSKKLEVEKPGAKYLPAVRLGRWNGKVSYFSISAHTYINLLDVILPVLYEHGYDIDIEDQRDYQTSFEFEPVDESYWSDYVWPEGHVMAGQPIELKDHQVALANTFFSNLQSIQSAPTGSGKTLLAITLSKKIEPYGRSIIIVPNKSLVIQTEEDYINGKLDVGVYYGDRKELNRTHTICTWQSLSNLLKETMDGTAEYTIHDFIEGVVCVICDEAHCIKGQVLRDLLTGILAKIPIRWGVTGTIPKHEFDQLALLVGIGPVVSKLETLELQEKGILAKCHVNIIQLKDGKGFKDYQSELKFLTTDPDRLDTIANIIEKISSSGNTLVLVDRVSTGNDLVERIADSVFVSGKTKVDERKEEYNEIRTSNNKVLIATYGVAAVGISINRIFNLVMIEPGKSFVRVIQSIGRGVRVAEDKDFVDIWDITSDCKFAKRHLTQRKAFYKEQNYPFSIEKLDY